MTTHISGLDKSEYYSVVNDAGDVISSGRIDAGLYLHSTSPVVIHDQNENAYLDQMNTSSATSPDLPAAGAELTTGEVYAWNGQNVIVRQDHTRTEHDPDTVPALFTIYREDYDGMEWIANEEVKLGDERTHDGINYECIQPHTTVVGQTPDLVPALWVVIPDETGEWQTGVAYAIGDEVTYSAILYRCIQSHTSQPGWTPPAVPALWTPV
jgi:hypothetical protein